ncbi:MAG: extracellular catalytic domain type 1 short-chain-length polyhydroxyalkanoate depolymerase, partial [Gemmatimonadota bacterium]
MLQGSFTEHTFTSDAGSREYWLYVPSSYDGAQPVPLVVMLHGCTQDAPDIARGTRLNQHAERHGFIVVYPEQDAENPGRCWNWFEAGHQTRGAGEPAIIAGITRAVLQSHRVDAARVFMAGISAGAAMANVVAVTHPELYAALALHSGIGFKASETLAAARRAMAEGGPDPVTQGRLAHEAMGARARMIPVLVMHGLKDAVVPPLHAAQLEQQWLTIARRIGVPIGESDSNLTIENDYAVTRAMTLDGGGGPL